MNTNYVESRESYRYYRKSLSLISKIETQYGCTSIIDVGGWNGFFVARTQMRDATCLDNSAHPPADDAHHVKMIQSDFLEFIPEKSYDICCCMQVLEHIPEPEVHAFAKKLFDVGKHVVISVPFKWPEGGCEHHCQDPVDHAKLASWTGRKPDWSRVVSEEGPVPFKKRIRRLSRILRGRDPHKNRSFDRRLICYYKNS
ncbi:MAG: class I SAM-dependent methyltransferase [Coraliomargarita sp.]